MLETLPPPTPMIGTTVAVVLGVLVLFAGLALPMVRALTMTLSAFRWLLRAVPRTILRRRATGAEPTRPLHVDGLSTLLARFTRQTRTLAIELRRSSGEAAEWPAETAPARPRSGWRESLLGCTSDRAPLAEVRREVFEWLRIAENLPAADRETLASCGVDLEAVRGVLADESTRPADEVVRTLAGLLWTADERLAGASTAGYRASGAEAAVASASPASVSPAAAYTAGGTSDDEKARRRRWTGALADHGRGISRLAASYTRGAAEREDLEQDIALALWRALPTFRSESSLKTFAYKVARYCCFRHLRRRVDIGDAADPQTVADPTACIESAILHADQRARIEQALTDLPDNLESVLTMHLGGSSYAQIAEALGISERNVSVRLTRARAHLRRQLVAA
jgi:RNA polymerase sigma factor (sigma-70 family)